MFASVTIPTIGVGAPTGTPLAGALQILQTSPFDPKVYYTCSAALPRSRSPPPTAESCKRTMTPETNDSKLISLGGSTWEFFGTHPLWSCSKGKGEGRIVDLCAFQPTSYHKKSLAKKLKSPEEFVEIYTNP